MRLRFWPRSLAGRTAAILLPGLVAVQCLGLFIHALDRIDLQRLAQARDAGMTIMGIYRGVVLSPPDQRDEALREMTLPPGVSVRIQPLPPVSGPPTPGLTQHLIRASMGQVPLQPPLRPREVIMLDGPKEGRLVAGLRLPDGPWVSIRLLLASPSPFHSPTFLLAFVLMSVVAGLLTLWAVRRMTAPVATLAAAADRLGRDVNTPPLPENGPLEVATAAAAFNRMAGRIRRFVQDRTFMLTAIGHDLRTPITRLKLRTEFIDDDDMRRRMLADLDELEAMVNATLAFGRDATSAEPVTALDLAVLARTVLDEAADGRPECAERLHYDGPEHLTVQARSISLKRALSNLVSNAVAYGGGASVTVGGPENEQVTVAIEDDGPGIPPDELDRVFEPFHRVESSRNRETGGVGLGLPIARNILRAHGGDVTIGNRPAGGARAVVSLPV